MKKCSGATASCPDSCRHKTEHKQVLPCGEQCREDAYQFAVKNQSCMECELAESCHQWDRRQKHEKLENPKETDEKKQRWIPAPMPPIDLLKFGDDCIHYRHLIKYVACEKVEETVSTSKG